MRLRTLTMLSLCLVLLSPLTIQAENIKKMSKQTAYQLLKSDQHQAVRALAKGDREMLLAVLALEKNHVDEAIHWLSLEKAQGNPLALLIKGEAYRRKSLAAALRAGKYAHAAKDDITRLAHAELTPALQEAERRLQAFMILDKKDTRSQPEVKVATNIVRKDEDKVTVKKTKIEKNASITDANIASIRKAIEAWLLDWQSRDHHAYMSHYHPNFRTAKYDYKAWSAYKKRVNQKKKYIHITMTDFKVRTAASSTLQAGFIVSFQQQYQSSNYHSNSHKELYIVRSAAQNKWLIMDEGEKISRTNAKPIKLLSAQAGTSWVVNIASFNRLTNANVMRQKIQQQGFYKIFVSSVFVQGRRVHRVRIGPYPTKKEAQNTMHALCPKLAISGCWLENGA